MKIVLDVRLRRILQDRFREHGFDAIDLELVKALGYELSPSESTGHVAVYVKKSEKPSETTTFDHAND